MILSIKGVISAGGFQLTILEIWHFLWMTGVRVATTKLETALLVVAVCFEHEPTAETAEFRDSCVANSSKHSDDLCRCAKRVYSDAEERP